MIQELIWIYGCNVVINSVMSFATTLLFVAGGLALFRVKEPRTRAIVMTVPLFKLVIDLFLYNFSDWALMHQINPMEAEPGTRTLMMWFHLPALTTTGIQLLMSNGKTFTLADMMTLSIDPFWVKIAVATVAALSAWFTGIWIIRFRRSLKIYRVILSTAKPCQRPIFSMDLGLKVQKAKIEVMTSNAISVPCALGVFKRYIIFPEALVSLLTQTEFEAVIAHEYDHLRWYDSVVRLGGSFLSSVFWWVPARWCLMKIERLQEYACDKMAAAKGLAAVDLAGAIHKAAKFAKHRSAPCFCAYFVDRYTMTLRISRLLEEPQDRSLSIVRWIQYLALGACMSLILLGKFWIF